MTKYVKMLASMLASLPGAGRHGHTDLVATVLRSSSSSFRTLRCNLLSFGSEVGSDERQKLLFCFVTSTPGARLFLWLPAMRAWVSCNLGGIPA